MAFKAKNKGSYNAWRVKNLHALLRAGVPMRIASHDRQFWYVVQEGEEVGYQGWSPDWLSREEAEELLGLLSGFLGGSIAWDLIDRLRRKVDDQCTE